MPTSMPYPRSRPPRSEPEQIAAVAKALAHPVRVEIVTVLMSREGCIAGDIVDAIGLAQSTVSEHLRILKAAGVINGTIEHPRICYALNPEAVVPLRTLLAEVAAHTRRPVAACYTPEPRAAVTASDTPAAKPHPNMKD